MVSPLSRTTSSWVSEGRGSRPTDVTTASWWRIASRYVSGSSASPRSQRTAPPHSDEAMCAGGAPPRVTHVTESPRRTASAAMALPTMPVPPNTMSRRAACCAGVPISRQRARWWMARRQAESDRDEAPAQGPRDTAHGNGASRPERTRRARCVTRVAGGASRASRRAREAAPLSRRPRGRSRPRIARQLANLSARYPPAFCALPPDACAA